MALPKSKYSEPRHTPGKEFILNGVNYVGWYIVTYRNQYFTGKELTETSKELEVVTDDPKIALPLFVEQLVEPDSFNRKNGNWTRYFVQKLATLSFIEVNREKYLEFQNIPGYKVGELNWKIKGPAENVTVKDYVYFGAEHVNMHNTKALESSLKGISSYIKDYTKFVE